MSLFQFRSVLLALTLFFGSAVAASQTGESVISRFSEKPVPRFESLRFGEVNGRQGPSADHRIIWKYQKLGLPILILRETKDWWRVRDHAGDEVWIKTNQLSSRRTVLLTQDSIMRRNPSSDAAGIALLKTGLIAELRDCENNWCQIAVRGEQGWIPETDMWGAPSQLFTGSQ